MNDRLCSDVIGWTIYLLCALGENVIVFIMKGLLGVNRETIEFSRSAVFRALGITARQMVYDCWVSIYEALRHCQRTVVMKSSRYVIGGILCQVQKRTALPETNYHDVCCKSRCVFKSLNSGKKSKHFAEKQLIIQ